LLANKEC